MQDAQAINSVLNRFTLVWHTEKPNERDWIEKIFRPYLKRIVTDGRHELVLDECILCDAFVYARDPAYYSKFRGKNAFLVHFLDENYEGHYELYQNFKGVFRAFWSKAFNPDYVRALPLGAISGVGSPDEHKPALNRRYIWSFVGQANKSTRVDVIRTLMRVEPHYTFATDEVPGLVNGAKLASHRLSPAEYSEILGDSIFAPSPMGNVNLECYRIYDALECGAIPIVERRTSFDYFKELLGPHPLPVVYTWTEAHRLIAKFLKSPESITQLQQECISWWAEYQQKYTSELAPMLATRGLDDSTVDRPMYRPQANSRGWQIRELLKHHNAAALVRRTRLQASRLLAGGGFRVAIRPGHPPE